LNRPPGRGRSAFRLVCRILDFPAARPTIPDDSLLRAKRYGGQAPVVPPDVRSQVFGGTGSASLAVAHRAKEGPVRRRVFPTRRTKEKMR
jgi:hypothetical protein